MPCGRVWSQQPDAIEALNTLAQNLAVKRGRRGTTVSGQGICRSIPPICTQPNGWGSYFAAGRR